MECTLAAIIACFSWSNFYVDSHLSVIDAPVRHYRFTGASYVEHREYQNPYAGFGIGIALPINNNLTISFEASHMLSSVTSRDDGINAVSVRARWYPFRR